MKSTTLNLIVLVAMLIIPTDGQAQSISDSVIGKTYFANSRSISVRQKMHPQEFDLVPVLEFRSPHWVFVRKNTPDVFLQIQDGLELWRSQNALTSFVLSRNNCRLPLLFESSRSNILLARWEGRFPNHKPTKILPKKQSQSTARSANDHFELVWSPAGFKLNGYKNKDNRSRKCSPSPPAVLTETIPLMVHSHESSLVLRPNTTAGILPWFVILSNNGNAQVAMTPIEAQEAKNSSR